MKYYINIVHQNENLIEYICLKTFLDFFGIYVFNSSCTDELKSHINTSSIQIINVVIVNSQVDIEKFKETNLHNNEKNIFISSYNSKSIQNENVITFPLKMYNADGSFSEYYKIFFKKVLVHVSDILKTSTNDLLNDEAIYLKKEINRMVEIFTEFNIFENLIIPKYIPIARMYLANNIKDLFAKFKNTNFNDDLDTEESHLLYAYVNLKYIINKLCYDGNFVEIIPWNEIFNDIEKISLFNSNKKYANLAGNIYYTSEKNNMLAEYYLLNSIQENVTYHSFYQLAQFYNSRFVDREKSKKYLKKAISVNGDYYKASFLLSILYLMDSDTNIEALPHCLNNFFFILKRINNNYFAKDEILYLLKSYNEMLKLSGHIEGKRVIANINIVSIINKMTCSIDNNNFFKDLVEFSSKNELEAQEKLSEIREWTKEYMRELIFSLQALANYLGINNIKVKKNIKY